MKLHARVPALPGGFGNLPHQVARAIDLGGPAVGDAPRRPILVVHHRLHELVGDAHAVVGVLEEDGAVSITVQRRIVARVHQRPGLALLFRLAPDKIQNVGMVNVQDDHLRRPARLSAGLDDTREGVVTLHEGKGTGGHTAARQ